MVEDGLVVDQDGARRKQRHDLPFIELRALLPAVFAAFALEALAVFKLFWILERNNRRRGGAVMDIAVVEDGVYGFDAVRGRHHDVIVAVCAPAVDASFRRACFR